ncbi:MAG TPA: 4Fe-4S double cluster binding domain-containing protein, partial [Bacillota bacterium]|nr:4Fe-4S double cluster binding domain-containing protein [Bacillota bacterium]
QTRLTETLLREGAAAVGFADISELPEEERHGFKYAVSIVVTLKPEIVRSIAGGPNHAYCQEYKRTNNLLSELGRCAVHYLEQHGYSAMPLKPTGEDFDKKTLSAGLSHKAVATRAGLGWIGKSALLITEQFGAAFRLNSVLTEAPFESAGPVNESRCAECVACVKACPGQAILNRNWQAGLAREALLDAGRCYQTANNYAKSLQIDSTICGVCIAACPWTKKFLSRENRF